MRAMLTCRGIHKSYGHQIVLNDVSFVLNDGEHIGLVGPNGVGKSTLLRILTGAETPDSGQFTFAPGARVGYLAQNIPAPEHTVADMMAAASREVRALETQMRELETQMQTAQGDVLDSLLTVYGDVLERFEHAGGYDIEQRMTGVMSGLGVDHLESARPFASLSGGEKARMTLGLLLVRAPDLLLLDEPTNHLDFARLDWLESYLRAYRGAALLVSHDRQFLNRTVSAVIEIDEHSRRSRRYSGDYDAYDQAKRRERRQWQQDFARQQEEIRSLQREANETARRNDHYRAHSDHDQFVLGTKRETQAATVSKRVRAAEEKLARILADPIPRPPRDMAFDYTFRPDVFESRVPLFVSGLSKAYGERRLLDSLDFSVSADSRIVLVGPNGAGKSTLIRLLVGLETPDSGSVRTHPAAKIGYLPQEDSRFDPRLSAFEAYVIGLDGAEHQHKARLLEMGLFRYDELDKRVGELSAGQVRKLQIARLIAEQANLLILDEPTNHASLDVVEGLEAALSSFRGPVIAATHDRRFMRRLAYGSHPAEIWALVDGRILRYPGGWEEYSARL
jgi:macrolide transport system ATP-binding/permease protein